MIKSHRSMQHGRRQQQQADANGDHQHAFDQQERFTNGIADDQSDEDRNMNQRGAGHEIGQPNRDTSTIDTLPKRKQQRDVNDRREAE
jgi:hypothetical protein